MQFEYQEKNHYFQSEAHKLEANELVIHRPQTDEYDDAVEQWKQVYVREKCGHDHQPHVELTRKSHSHHREVVRVRKVTR